MINPHDIERFRIDELKERMPFTIVRFPQTPYGLNEEPRAHYDYNYLRVSRTLEEAVEKSKDEFLKYGFSEGRFIPDWLTGNFVIGDGRVEIKPDWNKVKGFNFWIPEGLIGEYFNNIVKREFPKIETPRERTKRIYRSIHDCSNIEEYDGDLIQLLRSPDEECSIILVSRFLDKFRASQAGIGHCPGDIQVMNYARIWGRHSTYFKHPETEQWYQLLNKDVINESQARFSEECGIKVPKLNMVVRIDGATFRECDKVGGDRNMLFFDGSLEDIFEMLKERGVGFEEGIIKTVSIVSSLG